MKTSTILQRSMKYLWDGKGDYTVVDQHPSLTRFVCISMENYGRSLEDLGRRDGPVTEDFWDKVYGVQHIIEQRIGGTYFEEWLSRRGFISASVWGTSPSWDWGATRFRKYLDGYGGYCPEFEAITIKVQEARKAWMKALIAEFKAKGD